MPISICLFIDYITMVFSAFSLDHFLIEQVQLLTEIVPRPGLFV